MIVPEFEINTAVRVVQIEPPRDRRGRIRWKLPGRTEEENLQIGISNVQWLFLNAFPDFEQQFPRDRTEMIIPEKREGALNFILQCFRSNRDFIKYMGGSALLRRSAPYFEGSLKIALRKSFFSWGIEFEDEQTRLIWSKRGNTLEENKQLGIKNLQQIMLSKIMEIGDTLVQIDGRTVVSPSQRDHIKRVILERCGGRNLFKSIIGFSPLDKKRAPYFNGSYSICLKESLEPWGIQVFLKDFRQWPGLWAEKTEEECIAIMQTIWLETYPEFIQFIPPQESHVIEAEKRADAHKFILKRIDSAANFKAIFSGTPMHRNIVSCFEGSYITAVRKTFRNWGINFKIRDFTRNRNLWYRKEKDEILETMRTIFLEEHPEFREMLMDEDSGRVKPEKTQEAKLLIVKCVGSAERFRKVFSRMYRSLGDSHTRTIEEVFAPMGVQFKLGEIRGLARNTQTDTPQGWMTTSGVARVIGKYYQKVKDIAKRYRPEHPEWFRMYTTNGRSFEHYAPELILKIKELSEKPTETSEISSEDADEALGRLIK